MSSVGSSDSSDRSDKVVRRNREEFRQNESDLIKKHQKELRRINEQHYREVENLKQAHDRHLSELKQRSSDAMSVRDHRYQTEMEEMRSLYRKQLQQLSEESTQKQDALRKSVVADSDQAQAQSDSRLEKLHQEYAEKLNARERQFRETLNEMREDQRYTVESNREKLQRAHGNEMGVVRGERNQTVGRLENELSSYREGLAKQKQDHELAQMKQKQRSSETMLRAVGRERSASAENAESLREGFQEGLSGMRARYEKIMKKELDANRLTGEQLTASVSGRMDDQIRRLEYENQELKDAKVRSEVQSKAKAQREIGNMRDAFTKNMEAYQNERDEVIRSAKDNRQKALAEQFDRLSDEMAGTNRSNLQRMERMEHNSRVNRRAAESMKEEFQSRHEYSQALANRRVQKVLQESEASKAQMAEMHKEVHTAQQKQNAEDMKQIRNLMDDDKNAAVTRMKDVIRRQEIKHSEQMSGVIDKYEKQVRDLKDQIVQQRRQQEEALRRTAEQLQSANKTAIDTLESQNRDRMRQANLQHTEQLRTLNKRHEEKLDQVIAEVKKT